MKKTILTIFGLAVAVMTIAQELAVNSLAPAGLFSGTAIAWEATTFDFGVIPSGKPVTHEFTFTNKGEVPLIITSVKASCGCTVTAYSKEPIAPGTQGFVKATYDAAKSGRFSKTVTVNANTESEGILLTIKGEVQ